MDDVDFGTLYERYAQDVFRFAVYLTGNRAEAEDVASETFVRAWVTREEIRVGTVKAYLLVIARNLCRTWSRTGLRPGELDEHARDPRPGPAASASASD
jgi:RNA polymerase sigma-70 factor (ECF subfamily)